MVAGVSLEDYAVKCKINNQKSRASPAQTWIALEKLVAGSW